LVARIFQIFARERLGYNVTILSSVSAADPETTLSLLSSCRTQLCDDLDSVPGELRVPAAMLSLDSLLGPSDWVDRWGLVDAGQLGPAVRPAWLLPARLAALHPGLDHWRALQHPNTTLPFLLQPGQWEQIQQLLRRPGSGHNRYWCEESYCSSGMHRPAHCLGAGLPGGGGGVRSPTDRPPRPALSPPARPHR